MSRDNRAWKKVIEELNIDMSKDISKKIPAEKFREIADREARIAAKVDSREDLPTILKENDYFVLPVENGYYRLIKGEGFHDLEPISDSPETFHSQLNFKLTTGSQTGESKFLQYAYNSGLISEFAQIDDLYITETSRFRGSEFNFYVDKIGPIHQKGVQIQTDGWFESKDEIIIIEAKTRKIKNFNIRQLYYPYRHNYENFQKEIYTIFMYTNPETDTYRLWMYNFNDPEDYLSIELIRSKEYNIVEEPLDEKDIEVEKNKEIGWEIPQANSVDKIQKMLFLVNEGCNDSEKIMEFFDFSVRQSSYYREATEMLDLITHEKTNSKFVYKLTKTGKEYINMRPDKRNELLAQQILKLPIMNHIFEILVKKTAESLSNGGKVSKKEITEIIREKSNLSGDTPNRRASTLMSWFGWISENVGVIEKSSKEINLSVSHQTKLF